MIPKVYGKFTLLRIAGPRGGKAVVECECGNVRWIPLSQWKAGRRQSCGCDINHTGKHAKKRDVVPGMLIGAYTVIMPMGRWWVCKCDCGKIVSIENRKLKIYSDAAHCGCRQLTPKTRGIKPEERRTYGIWRGMLERCYNIGCDGYPNYGGRGISVCVSWRESFRNFLADVGIAPAGLSLDRINVNGNYEPGNVRWVNQKAQCQNKRNNVNITANGETFCVTEWARRLKCNPCVIFLRLRNGWDPETAVTTPVRFRRKVYTTSQPG